MHCTAVWLSAKCQPNHKMSSRVLRKLHGDRDLGNEVQEDLNSDLETDILGAGGAKKKQLHVNRFDLLNQQSHSESEVKEDDDHETEATVVPERPKEDNDVSRKKRKKKKKKPGKGHSINNRKSSDDNIELEVEDDLLVPNMPSPAIADNKLLGTKPILYIKRKNLNASNELKRIFGSRVLLSDQRRRSHGRAYVRCPWLVRARDNWPPIVKTGITMKVVKPGHFTYEHNAQYREVQKQFLDAVDSLIPDNFIAIVNKYPFHVDALIQLSDLCKLSEDLQMAAELVERALYCLENAFHPLFNPVRGLCNLDYKRQENRCLFVALFKHLLFVGARACYRTALELCKFLLSLDVEGDPLGVVLCIDFYALRAQKYEWLVNAHQCWLETVNLLPNFAYSYALAKFHLAGDDADRVTEADELLQDALLKFPGVLLLLLDKCSVQPDTRVSTHPFFTAQAGTSRSQGLLQLEQLYVGRTYHEWKIPEVLQWLESNVHRVLDRVDSKDPLVEEYRLKRLRCFQQTPKNVLRHITLSDIKDVTVATASNEVPPPGFAFDPFPPYDSVDIYTRPIGRRVYNSSNTLSLFFRSLMPNFNANEPPLDLVLVDEPAEPENNPPEEGATGIELRRSVTSLLVAMRDLLSDVYVPDDAPNDGDGEIEENDSDDSYDNDQDP